MWAKRQLDKTTLATLLPMARQKMGQHFLADLAWRKRILATLPLSSADTWIEIGAGHGEMTRILAHKARRVFAIEADTRLAARLQSEISENPAEWPGIQLIAGSILETDLGALSANNFRVYGNLPYYITSPILQHLFQWRERILSIHAVMQLEVAQRIAATPGRREYGYLSVASQFFAKPEIVLRIPPGAFSPPPKVVSALVEMSFPGESANLNIRDEKRFLEFVGRCFSQKRKTLRNNLLSMAKEDRIQVALRVANLRPDARAEQLSLPQFATLFHALDKDL